MDSSASMARVLPSSPPQARRSPYRDGTPEYSLDIDALLLTEGSSAIMTPPTKHLIDAVYSEDIDGPTDFTQNLEYWMTAKLPNVTKPARIQGQAKNDMEDFISSGANHESEVQDERQDKDEAQGYSEIAGDGISFLDSLPRAEISASTPKTAERISSDIRGLQPSVESYDETPSRAKESSSTIRPVTMSPGDEMKSHDGGQEQSNSVNELSSTASDLEKSLTKLREELDHIRAQGQQNVRDLENRHEKEMESYKLVHDKHLNEREDIWQIRLTKTKMDFEQQLRTAQHRSAFEWQERLQEASVELLSKNAKITELEMKMSEQAKELQNATLKTATLEQSMESLSKKHAIIVEALKQSSCKKEPNLAHSQPGLRESESRLLDRENEISSLEAELANLKLLHINEIDKLNGRIEEAESSAQQAFFEDQRISGETISALEAENASLHTQLDKKDDYIDMLEEQFRGSSEQIISITKERNATLDRFREQKKLNGQAVIEIQALQAKSAKLQSRCDETTQENAKNARNLKELERQLIEANSARLSADDEVDSARTEIATFKAAAELLDAEAKTARAGIEAARSDLLVLKEDHEAVNKAIDGRIKGIMRMREREWQKRFEVLENELAMRGRVLMKEWGARDVGNGEPQAYRYRYV